MRDIMRKALSPLTKALVQDEEAEKHESKKGSEETDEAD
jgi:hypothetical protein